MDSLNNYLKELTYDEAKALADSINLPVTIAPDGSSMYFENGGKPITQDLFYNLVGIAVNPAPEPEITVDSIKQILGSIPVPKYPVLNDHELSLLTRFIECSIQAGARVSPEYVEYIAKMIQESRISLIQPIIPRPLAFDYPATRKDNPKESTP